LACWGFGIETDEDQILSIVAWKTAGFALAIFAWRDDCSLADEPVVCGLPEIENEDLPAVAHKKAQLSATSSIVSLSSVPLAYAPANGPKMHRRMRMTPD